MVKRVIKRRAAARILPGIEAYNQGELDGLCGIYAVINAYRLLYGDKFPYALAHRIFRRMAKASPLAVFEGLGYRELLDLIALANRAVPQPLRLEVRTDVFKKQANGPAWRTDTYVKRLREEVNEQNQVAILGLERAHEHWTLVHRLTNSTVKLTDSDNVSHLRLANIGITVKTRKNLRINPSQTILLRPWMESPNALYKKRKPKTGR